MAIVIPIGHRVLSPQKPAAPPVQQAEGSDDDDDDEDEKPAGGKLVPSASVKAKSTAGSLKPMPHFDGGTTLTFRIERIKLKDPGQYMEPYITVSVKGMYLCTRG